MKIRAFIERGRELLRLLCQIPHNNTGLPTTRRVPLDPADEHPQRHPRRATYRRKVAARGRCGPRRQRASRLGSLGLRGVCGVAGPCDMAGLGRPPFPFPERVPYHVTIAVGNGHHAWNC